jgi:isopenicillin-N epimerase
MNELRQQFLLDPEVIFLNHGSFGASPRPVFEIYQKWGLRLENQPVEFLGRKIQDHLREARTQLGSYLGADPGNLVFIPNATFGVNIIASSLDFQPGDQVLTSNHEYGACDNVWSFWCQKKGIEVIRQPIPLPLTSKDEIVETFWKGVSDRTRLIFLSQITSPTAVRFPVEEVSLRAREAGIMTLIDGAHAPGQINLHLDELGADFYTGNCHKWLLAPKGAAFLYTRPERQGLIQPLVVSWGWGENCPYENDSQYHAYLEWWGTIDPAPYLAVPAAIQFQKDHDWTAVRKECRRLLENCLSEIDSITGMPSIYGKDQDNFHQLGAAELPKDSQPERLQSWLYEKFKIEIPVIDWEGRWLIRPSVQGYNTESDLKSLLSALRNYYK